MPQMAPINWLILFIIFSFILLTFSMKNYFYYTHTPSTTPQLYHMINKSMNWKW